MLDDIDDMEFDDALLSPEKQNEMIIALEVLEWLYDTLGYLLAELDDFVRHLPC